MSSRQARGGTYKSVQRLRIPATSCKSHKENVYVRAGDYLRICRQDGKRFCNAAYEKSLEEDQDRILYVKREYVSYVDNVFISRYANKDVNDIGGNDGDTDYDDDDLMEDDNNERVIPAATVITTTTTIK